MLLLLSACISFAGLIEGSGCKVVGEEMGWRNPPEIISPAPPGGRPYDLTIHDAAQQTGVLVAGDVELELRARGEHLVEVFLRNLEVERHPFRLVADGKVLHEGFVAAPGPDRMRPKSGWRNISLIAMVQGPRRLTVKTTSPGYVLSMARWTPVKEYEAALLPKYVERGRYLLKNVLLEGQEGGPMARRHYVQQVYDRVYPARDKGLHKEAVLGLARAWFWLAAENHEPDDLLRTEELFKEGLRLDAGNPILRQMISVSCNGPIPRMPRGPYCAQVRLVEWTVDVPAAPAGAPGWAVAQRRLARRMEAITSWWVEKRQAENGEIGGGWGDDVEILRQWGPQALGLGSKSASRGILKMTAGLWTSGQIVNGYDRRISDVEHSSEPTTDTAPLTAAISPESAAPKAWLAETAACAEHWIKKQPDGAYRFRSSWFNCREADTSSARALDVHMNTRAMGPALWHAYLSRDEKTIKLLGRWADSWIAAMRDTRHGKPAGAIPPALRSSDGSYLVGSQRWDKPDAEWDYFQYSGGSQEAIVLLFLAAHELTGEKRYLDAAGESFQPLQNCAAHAELCKQMTESPGAFLEWRRRTGDARYDRHFAYRSGAPAGEVLARMEKMALESEASLAHNFDMFTSEVMYTDRVYYQLPSQYRWHLFGGETPRGDRYPTFTVTWPPTQGEYARAVVKAEENEVELAIYSFASQPMTAPVRLWRLAPGEHEWRMAGAEGKFMIGRLPYTLDVPLPAGREVRVKIRRAN